MSKEKTNCGVCRLDSQSDPLRLFSELQLGLSWSWVWDRMELSFKVPKNYASRANFIFLYLFLTKQILLSSLACVK